MVVDTFEVNARANIVHHVFMNVIDFENITDTV